MKPDIIFLSGASSSGKSTLMKEITQSIARPNVIGLELDAFFKAMSPQTFRNPGNFEEILPKAIDSFHKAIAVYATNNFLVIVDSLIQEAAWFENYRVNTGSFSTFWVRVFCPIEELARREKSRGDRKIGLAASQFDKVHRWPKGFDLTVDTAQNTAKFCVGQIVERTCLQLTSNH